MASFISEDQVNFIRESAINSGISGLKSHIKEVKIEIDSVIEERRQCKPKYSKKQIAEKTVELYKTNIKQQPEQEKEKAVPCTIASRANIRALSNSLANIRNGGFAGPTTEFTPSANGDVNPGRPGGYNALVVAGTEMTLEDYKEEVESRMEACWAGYKKKGMKKMFGKMYPNCVKEERKPGETAQEYKERMQKKYKGAKLKTYDPMEDDNFDHDEAEKTRGANTGKPKFESALVDELKDKLVEMDNHSWQSIDKVMRELAKEHDITPKELHKQFKAESNGMIPDDWAKKHAVKEEAGFMPLDEAATLYKMGNVYDVSLMWRAHTRRLKFFWPEMGMPSRDDMQRAVELFYPGGKLLSYYVSMDAADNQNNFIVVVPPLRESVWLPAEAWEEMTDTECGIYEYILSEEGEPTSPPMMHEDGSVEVWVEDHETGEERQIFFSEKEGKKDACYHKVKSRYKVWPSAYASGALVKCRKKGAGSWGNSTKKEEFEYIEEKGNMDGMTIGGGHKRSTESGAGLTQKGVEKYRRQNPGSKLKTAVTTPPSKLKPGSKAAKRRKSFCARSRGWTGERGKAARRRWNC